jgi:VIT1/CCC1 family predicted Fe2+/Mn2+ transporter
VNETVRRYLENWQSEVDSAAQYDAMAEAESNPQLKRVYENLARAEEKHVLFWEKQLQKAGVAIPKRRPTWRSRLLIRVAKTFGPQLVLPTLAAGERMARNVYARQSETQGTKITAEEHWHTRVLEQMERTSRAGVSGGALARIEGRHRAVGGNALRAAVLGANDGLCSNMSLVMGVAGASADSRTLLLAGIAGLVAGSFSMALGEWLSVTSSRELNEREIRVETLEFELDPQAEGEELKLIYEAKGLSPTEARELAAHMISDKSRAIEALTREELGLDPEDLGGRAGEAALYSFALFAFGAAFPVLPFILFGGLPAVAISLGLSTLTLFAFGALITVFTGRSALQSGLRQMLLGLTASGATFLIGRVVGGAF